MRGLVTLVLLGLMASTPAATQGDIRWKFTPGQTLHYRYRTSTSVADPRFVASLGSIILVPIVVGVDDRTETCRTDEVDFVWEVVAVDQEGKATIRGTITRVQSTARGNRFFKRLGIRLRIPGPTGLLHIPQWTALLDQPFTWKLDPQGRWSELTLPAAVRDPTTDLSDAFQLLLDAGLALPAAPGKPGETWQERFEQEDYTETRQYRLQSQARWRGHDLARIDMRRRIDVEGNSFLSGSGRPREAFSYEADGEASFDLDAGQLVAWSVGTTHFRSDPLIGFFGGSLPPGTPGSSPVKRVVQEVSVRRIEDGREVHVVLENAPRYRVTMVSEADRTPVARARIETPAGVVSTGMDGAAEVPIGPVTVMAEGFVPCTYRVARGFSRTRASPSVLQLPEAATLLVHVRDESGKAVAGARVNVHPVLPSQTRLELGVGLPVQDAWQAVSDAKGEARVSGLPAGRSCRVNAWSRRGSQGVLKKPVRLRTGKPTEASLVIPPCADLRGTVVDANGRESADRTHDVILEMPDAGELNGRVVDDTGHAALGATVTLQLLERAPKTQRSRSDRSSYDGVAVRTALGFFRFSSLVPGRYALVARTRDRIGVVESLTVPGGQVVRGLKLRVKPGATLALSTTYRSGLVCRNTCIIRRNGIIVGTVVVPGSESEVEPAKKTTVVVPPGRLHLTLERMYMSGRPFTAAEQNIEVSAGDRVRVHWAAPIEKNGSPRISVKRER
jgi:hypothetical protein